jgi:magnesium-protoporphyrin IX monomethyl ester (oxidative) cyclase
MYRIALVNMPFAAINMPSLALTQLKTVVEARFPGQVSVEVIYLNQEFVHYLGLEPYESVTTMMEHHDSGLGDWFFRQAAFPDALDNSEQYLRRYYAVQSKQVQMFKLYIQQKRKGLDAFLGKLMVKYKLHQSNMVGFTSMFSQNVACIAMARKIKIFNPRIVAVLGGANCESPMGQEIIKNVSSIDFVFSGPALRSFPAMVESLLKGEAEKCHSIDGVFTKINCTGSQPEATVGEEHLNNVRSAAARQNEQPEARLVTLTRATSTTSGAPNGSGAAPNGNGAVKIAALGPELDLDVNVRLDYDYFLNTLEKNFPNKKVSPILLFETSRGCWWGEKAHCTFCGLNGLTMNYRAMSPDTAIEQFELLFKYAPRCTHYQNVDNILAKNYLQDVFPYLHPPENATIFYEVKADLSEEDIKLLAQTSVKLIQPGIEALSTSTLKLMKKGTSVFQNLVLLKNCAKYNVFPVWNLLVGFPGEGEEVYKKYVDDLPLLTHLPPPNGAFPVRFDRYSPYFNKAKEYGLDLQPFDFYDMTYPFDKESLSNLAYYFVDANYHAEYRITLSKWMTQLKEKAQAWRLGWLGYDSGTPAHLYFKESAGRTVVYDSRQGQAVEHPISDTGLQVLRALDKAKRVSQLSRDLSHIQGFDPAREVAHLQERGFVFQEHDRFLNLVLSSEPPRSFTAAEGDRLAEKAKETGTVVRELAPASA